MKKGNPKSKSEEQKSDFREKIITFVKIFLFCSLKINEKAKHGKVLNILISKQMLQRLPIAFTELKAGNTSKNLLNEI